MFNKEEVYNNETAEQPVPYGKKTTRTGWIGVPMFDVPLALAILNHKSAPIGHVTLPWFRDCILVIRVSGDDMCPKICNGDYIFCKEINVDEIIMGDDYLILTKKGTEIIRNIQPYKTQDKYIILIPVNQSKHSMKLAISDINKIYKVKGVIKSY